MSWQKWRLRIGFTPREGLVLHEVGYEDRGTLRPIIYRASLAEMYVPYGDPAPTHRFKNVFDRASTASAGWPTRSTLGCDCVGEIRYFDGVVNDQDGEPMVIPNAICMHEEDAGIGWKHTDFRTEEVEVRRLRRLVISTIATVGNYEYGYFWYLYTDGTIEYEVKLTGVISTGAIAPGERPDARHAGRARALRPAPPALLLRAAGHGGRRQRRTPSCEVDSEPLPPGPGQPDRHRVGTKRTVLATEARGAARRSTRCKGRYWQIENPGKVSDARRPGRPTSSMPGDNVAPMFAPGLRASPRARASRTSTCGSRAYDPERALRGRRLPQPAPGRRRPAARGRRRTGRSRTPTSCSGTCSAPTTSCGRRTGR